MGNLLRSILTSILLLGTAAVCMADVSGGLQTWEENLSRFVTLSISPRSDSAAIINPLIEVDTRNGEFQLGLPGVSSQDFSGEQFLRGTGNYPVQLNVFFSDSSGLVLRGKSLPFDSYNLYYQFEQQRYVVELLQAAVRESSPQPVPGSAYPSKSGSDPSGPYTSSQDTFARFSGMLRFGLVGLATIALTILLFAVFTRVSRVTKKRQVDSGVQQLPAEAVQPSQEMDPSEKEAHIRYLMEDKSISYDEAAIRVNHGGQVRGEA